MPQLLLLQTAFQVFFAVVNYYGIVQRRRTVEAYLLGWGVVLPIAFALPYGVLEALNIQSRVIKMASATPTFIVGFRTVEAMYGTAPPTVESTLVTYATYYSTLVHFCWDPKSRTRRVIRFSELLANARHLAVGLLMLSAVMSFEMHYKFEPFASPVKLDDFHLTLDLLSPAHLGNAYCLAVLTYLTLSFGLELTAFGEQVKGYYTAPIFANPLFTSTSPSDFWGRRWNVMIHRILKYGAFLPARQFVSVPAAVVFTFVVSGVMHDYVWSLVFYQHKQGINTDGRCLDCFVPVLLKLTAFFGWNGVVMLLERPLGPYLRTVSSRLPTAVVSTLVVLTALPVSHWYSGDWAKGGYFRDLSIGVWLIRKL